MIRVILTAYDGSNLFRTQKVVVAMVVCDPTRFKPHGLPMPDPIWTKDDVLLFILHLSLIWYQTRIIPFAFPLFFSLH